ncbi:helix-turn-helix transcriptional regulator [Hydrogenophaga sp. NFH-34]|uniref:helix-turn-helix transcriptional regulator n=1 Tax=Hydrogenophaga sp. NFH-34 TaxID=2744446 RepID=UPI002DD429EA|nr:AlpA family phage regulatory protein [Hydrogenophaga sp. NFH-34]
MMFIMAKLDSIPPLYLEHDEVLRLTTLSASLIHSMVIKGEFPAPRQLSQRRSAWLYREIVEWAENRPVSDIPPPANTGARKSRVTCSQATQDMSPA